MKIWRSLISQKKTMHCIMHITKKSREAEQNLWISIFLQLKILFYLYKIQGAAIELSPPSSKIFTPQKWLKMSFWVIFGGWKFLRRRVTILLPRPVVFLFLKQFDYSKNLNKAQLYDVFKDALVIKIWLFYAFQIVRFLWATLYYVDQTFLLHYFLQNIDEINWITL